VECKQGVIKWISQETLDKEKEKKELQLMVLHGRCTKRFDCGNPKDNTEPIDDE